MAVVILAHRKFYLVKWLILSIFGLWIGLLLFNRFLAGQAESAKMKGVKVVFNYIMKNLYQQMFFFMIPFYYDTTTVTVGETTERRKAIVLLTTPTSSSTMTIKYYKTPTEMTGDTDLPNSPWPHSQVLVYDALLALKAYAVESPELLPFFVKQRNEALYRLYESEKSDQTLGSWGSYIHAQDV